MKRLISTVLTVVVHCAASAAYAADVSVQTRRQGDTIIVEASAEFADRMEQAWAVLTDYEHLSRFIPNMESSKVVARNPAGPVVEQKGVARMWVFSYPFEVRLAVREFPPYKIESRGEGGSFKQFHGVYELSVVQGRTRLRYVCEMIPDFFMPPLFGAAVLKQNVEESFRALADEIVRRSEASGAGRTAGTTNG